MSLLIKALDKAQGAKVKQAQEKRAKTPKVELTMADTDSALSLSTPEAQLLEKPRFEPDSFSSSILESAASTALKESSVKALEKSTYKPNAPTTNKALSQAAGATPTQAANVFSAKRIEASHQNAKLAVIAGAGLIAMLAMGVYYYQFVDSTPEVPMPPIRPPHIVAAPTPVPLPAEPISEVSVLPEIQPAPDTTQAFEPKVPTKLAQKQKNEAKTQNADPETVDVENTLDANEVVAAPSKKSAKSNMVKMDKAIASESASIQVSQSKPQDAINPTLLRAYEAYNAGNLSEAQKLYKQVLQRDSSNVDAMLGLGAIASSQGRVADANGWYRKVLSNDPRNSTAQAGLLESQQQNDPQAGESHIKSMLAKSPNDANLHTALGDLYAEQNQWPAAQQAYFDAFRLTESAENALNLGVSLDHMGKPKLALPYYQQALQMAQQLSVSGIDKAALEARIAAIQ